MNLLRKYNLLLIFLLLSLLYCMFFHRLGAIALLDFDEPRYAEAAREMIELQSWLIPYFNYEVRLNKPILIYWLIISAYKTLGVSEFASRIWSAIAGVLGVGFVYLFGRRVFNPGIGLASALILASTFFYAVMAHSATPDMVLSLFIAISLMSFFLYYKNNAGGKKYLLLCIIALSLGTLTKGPVGVLVPALIITTFLLLTGNLRKMVTIKLLWGGLLFSVITLPWYMYAYFFERSEHQHVSYFVFNETLGRFFEGYKHPEPAYYYISVVLAAFFPWSCFLPFSFKHLFSDGWKKLVSERQGLLFVLVWFTVTFLFFSLCRSKLANYILPLAPAFAFLIGTLWHRYLTEPNEGNVLHTMKHALITLGVSLFVIGSSLLIAAIVRYPSFFLPALALFILCICSGALLLKTNLAERRRTVFFTILASTVCVFTLFLHFVAPALEEWRSTRSFFSDGQYMKEHNPVLSYRRTYPSSVFYSRKQIKVISYKEKLLDIFASKEPQFCIISKNKFTKLAEDFHSPFTVLKENNELLFITNQPKDSHR